MSEFSLGKPDHISYTQIQTYLKCPHLWSLIQLSKYRRPDSGPLLFGKSIHEAIASYSREYQKSGAHDLETMRDVWRSIAQDPDITVKPLPADLYAKGARLLERLLLENSLDLSHMLFMEYRFETKIQGVNLVGRFDRLDDHGNGIYLITDYKSGMGFPTQEQADADLELSIYALAWREIVGDPDMVVNVALHNVSTNIIVESIRDKDAMDMTADYICDIAARIEKDRTFKQASGDSCLEYGGCWAAALCPGQSLTKLPLDGQDLDLRDIENETLVKLYTSMETWSRRIRKLIRERAADQDLAAGDRKVVLKPSKRLIARDDIVAEFCKAFSGFGFDISDITRPDRAKIERERKRISSAIEIASLEPEYKRYLLETLDQMLEQMFIEKETTPAISVVDNVD